jgi:hypothetical protein
MSTKAGDAPAGLLPQGDLALHRGGAELLPQGRFLLYLVGAVWLQEPPLAQEAIHLLLDPDGHLRYFLLRGRWQRHEHRRLYGCATTGREWQFLCLTGRDRRVQQDMDIYYIVELPKLLGVFCHIVDTTLLALEAAVA